MSATQQKSILFVVTSADKGLTGKPTGIWATEHIHAYYVLKDSFKLTVASPKGGVAPIDPGSVEFAKGDEGLTRFQGDAEAQRVLNETVKLSDVKADDYDAVFYPGGHGPVVDLAFDEDSFKLINAFWAAGKPTSAVCHAPAVFVNVKLPSGEAFIKGKTFTGFTDEEEEQAGGAATIPFLLETELRKQGGVFERTEAWQPKVVVDGHLITGQNPASAGPLAEKLKEVLLA